jgi:hypothetical protein
MEVPSAERLRERLTEESLLWNYRIGKNCSSYGQVGSGGWFPCSTTTWKKVVTIISSH